MCQRQEGGNRGEQGRWRWAPGSMFSGWLWGHSGDQSPSQLWAKVDRLPPRTPLMSSVPALLHARITWEALKNTVTEVAPHNNSFRMSGVGVT